LGPPCVQGAREVVRVPERGERNADAEREAAGERVSGAGAAVREADRVRAGEGGVGDRADSEGGLTPGQLRGPVSRVDRGELPGDRAQARRRGDGAEPKLVSGA